MLYLQVDVLEIFRWRTDMAALAGLECRLRSPLHHNRKCNINYIGTVPCLSDVPGTDYQFRRQPRHNWYTAV